MCVCDFSSAVIIFPGKCALPRLHLLSCHTFKDSEIYEDIIFGPGTLIFTCEKPPEYQFSKYNYF